MEQLALDIVQLLTHSATTPLLIGVTSAAGICCSLVVLGLRRRKSKGNPAQQEIVVALDPSSSRTSPLREPPKPVPTPVAAKEGSTGTARFVTPLVVNTVASGDMSTSGKAIASSGPAQAPKVDLKAAAPNFDSQEKWTSPTGKVTRETGTEEGESVLVITTSGLTCKQLDDESTGLSKRLQKVSGLTFKRYKNLGPQQSGGPSQKVYVFAVGDSIDLEAISQITEDQAYA